MTFQEWDTCEAYGDCGSVGDNDWGHGRQPAINVSWDDAQRYVLWLSKMTGKRYRLLTEAEYEIPTRGGKQPQTIYPWGNDIGNNNANCKGCGSTTKQARTAPVGSFTANAFQLYDMVGNVWEWVEDCYHPSYFSAPPRTNLPGRLHARMIVAVSSVADPG